MLNTASYPYTFHTFLRALFLSAVLVLLVGCAGNVSNGTSSTMPMAEKPIELSSIKHVFVIMLENKSYADTFGTHSKAPYLSQTLTKQGAFLRQYYGTGHNSLDNYISVVSGQPASNETSGDCEIFEDFKQTGTTGNGLIVGKGCVYPVQAKTVANQLQIAGLSWKGYMSDMGNDPARERATCAHPALNTKDNTHAAQAPSAAVPKGDQYATRHNPFMYFHSHIDSADCGQHVVHLDALPQDLKSISTTANFNFITPNLCDDGHDNPCVNRQPGGLISVDAFLKKWVPLITASPAYQQDGLLIITFDESETVSTTVDPITHVSSWTFPGEKCCNQQLGPNLIKRPITITSANGKYATIFKDFGGDRTGAVLLSPFIKPGTVSDTPYNHYSLLKSVEDIFQLSYLGYAGESGLVGFGADVFTAMPH